LESITVYSNLRKTGIDFVKDIPWGTHVCAFYQTKTDLVNILVPYFKMGLMNNEFCMWVTSEPINANEAILLLKTSISNFNEYLERNQIEILSHKEWYLKYGKFDSEKTLQLWINKINKATQQGFEGIRISGNTTWLEKRYWKDFQRYEALVEKEIKQLKMIAICTYKLDSCNIYEITDIVNNHQFTFIKSQYSKELTDTLTRYDRINKVTELAASVAHEVKNPLTTVRGFLQLFKNKPKLEEYDNYFNLMLEELDRVNSIIDEYLSLARNKVCTVESNSINNIINMILPLLQSFAIKEDKNIKLELGQTPSLLLNSEGIRQIIINLVMNGLEAMSPGGNIILRTYTENNEVIFEVQDQGCGIEQNVLDKLGTPFFTTKANGNGLGLAVCYKIASQNNADITCKTSSSGTTFIVKFKQELQLANIQ